MNEAALFLELLLCGLFAIACFRARAAKPGEVALQHTEPPHPVSSKYKLRQSRNSGAFHKSFRNPR